MVRYCLRKFLSGVILIAFLFLSGNPSATASQFTKKLDNDTKIMPPGFIVATWSEIPKFKKGTVVTLNMYGEVLEGTLADDVNLPYETGTTQNVVKPTAMSYAPPPILFMPTYVDPMPKNRLLPFKGGTKVIFNDRGEAINGTLNGSDHNIVLNATNHIGVSGGEISFHQNGIPARCTLADNSYFRPVGWSQILTENITDITAYSGFIEFMAGKPVLLNEKGEVIKGTLNKDTKLRSLRTFLIGNFEIETKAFEAGTEVEFDEKGIAAKVSK
ncbi:hypothetical protein AXX12_09555 [Anaerosporomusa subterranea]|uniref:Uncharacterized protein n=1 Tax=Anaerosporomusa subterranea TaxID=1794912 RepID=A0A154BRS8_ANASB|nr:hypothetical protein [Anaerosporomusa subterranea]KYZ76656.1 hypothetical protein AXX12_09555 [Anaerosporomusa subterranea]